MTFQLKTPSQLSEVQENILDDLRSSSINFENDSRQPLVSIAFAEKGEAIDVTYRVETDTDVLQSGSFQVEPHERGMAGALLAYRLFGIQKSTIGEQPKAAPKPEKETAEKAV